MRALGAVRPAVIDRSGLAYLRVLAKTETVAAAGRAISGTLFWPMWLRLAGMRIGVRCEVSTILGVVPELIALGDECFFADGIYLGGPRVRGATVTLARTRLGSGTFLGNHVVGPAGTELPDDVLLGVCTVADATSMRAGTDWFGHPPLSLPRREIAAADRSVTHEPTAVRRVTRIVWESLRFTLPLTHALVLMVWWTGIAGAAAGVGPVTAACVVAPLALAAVAAALCVFVLVLKWALLGRVRRGEHPLWRERQGDAQRLPHVARPASHSRGFVGAAAIRRGYLARRQRPGRLS
jgi:non-ribosomal peptide synthetase-like protein